MSTQIFPSLSGLSWPVIRKPEFKTQILESVSGKEVRVAQRSAPRYTYTVSYEVLRKNNTQAEYQILMAFYNNRLGSFDTFLYNDVDDNSASAEVIGIGDGLSSTFQIVRAFGGPANPKWFDSILAPNAITAVYLNGVLQASSLYSVSNWGSATPGVITFVSPPFANVAVSVDMTWYWPCRFVDDTVEFTKNYQGLFAVSAISFMTVF